jgi:subtilisin-like proprotein convertase family protein
MRPRSVAHSFSVFFVLILFGDVVAAADRPRIRVARSPQEVGEARKALERGASPGFDGPSAAVDPLVSPPFVVEAEPNDSSGTATPLGGDAVIAEGNLFEGGDVDYWSFSAVTGDQVYVATMTGFSANQSLNSQLDVLATNGTTPLESDDDDGVFGATSSSIAGVTIPSSGTYYIRVNHFLGNGQLRPYRLFFQLRSGSPTAETESNDSPPGQVLPVGGWVSGSTSSMGDVDLFAFDLTTGDTVFVSLDLDPERDSVEWDGLAGLGTFDGFFLAADDGPKLGFDSEAFFMTVMESGSYSVIVAVPSGETSYGTYRLSVTVFPQDDEGESCTVYSSTDVPKTIPTGPGSVSSTLVVPGDPTIADLDVAIDLSDDSLGDLDVHLQSPASNDNGLFTDLASAESKIDFVLDDEAAIPVDSFDVFTGMAYAPESDYRLAWFDGEDAGGTWTLVVHDDLGGDATGTLDGWSVRICEPPALPVCPAGTERVVRYSSDFESDAGGFTHAGTNDEWERGLPDYEVSFVPVITTCASGSNCWATDLDGTYSNSSDQDLVSPAIDLTDLEAPILVSWAHRYQMEDATYDHYNVDLQWSGGGGASRLFEWLDYDQSGSFGIGSAVEETAGWGVVTRRADDYAGTSIQLQFHLDSDFSETYAGVAIDDVTVSGCLPSADIFSDGFESGDLSAWSSSVSGTS